MYVCDNSFHLGESITARPQKLSNLAHSDDHWGFTFKYQNVFQYLDGKPIDPESSGLPEFWDYW